MSNNYALEFLDKCNERFSIDSKNMTMSDWVQRNTTLKGKPFGFKRFEFQRQILDDMHPNLDCIKISQVGLTEIQIRKALAFLLRNNGTSLIFSLPNEDMYKRVSNSRVKPIVNKDRVFNTAYDKENKATRAMDMMQFGQSWLYMVPAIESAATSIPADAVFNDEVDLSDQGILGLFASRMQASTHKISQRFSTPTYPLFGIDLNWQTTDQHHYLCKCTACGHWNNPEFEPRFVCIPGLPEVEKLTEITEEHRDSLDFTNAYVKCERCHEPLDLGNSALRRWVSAYPSRVNSRGYRISPFSTESLDLYYIFDSMWKFYKKENRRGFHNTVLGLPYSDGTIQIPEEDIKACMISAIADDLEKLSNLWIGIDVGQTCHITIGQGPHKDNLRIVTFYEVHVDDLVSHCKELFEKYDFRGGCIDRHPYEPTSREVSRVTGGKIIPVEYRGQKEIGIVKNEFDEVTHAQVNRTWFLDSFATMIRKRALPIYGYGYKKELFITHLRDMVREEPEDGEGQPEWKKLHNNDHYFHSSAFMIAAPDILEVVRLKDDADQRMMAMGAVVQQGGTVPNLIGTSSSRKNLKTEQLPGNHSMGGNNLNAG